jgi:hypothetical protein
LRSERVLGYAAIYSEKISIAVNFATENQETRGRTPRFARAWTRWKRFAHRAAEVQAYGLLTILYGLVVIPVGLMRRRASRQVLGEHAQPAWQTRTADASADPLQDARQQF